MAARIETDRRAFLTGNEVVAWAALAAGAQVMFGYPITPTNEIMHLWVRLAGRYGRKFFQTEDELSAGFATLGAVLGGAKAFTATAGPGHVLLQEPLTMAEMMSLPVVVVIMQRGGPSTGTVIYSQQEVNLACFGGNGEGLRVVYSAAGLQDLYDYTIKAFAVAWRYCLPVIVLGDGYQAKMRGRVNLAGVPSPDLGPGEFKNTLGKPGVPGEERSPVHLRNTYNLEEELFSVLESKVRAYESLSAELTEYEQEGVEGAHILLVAHGIVANAARVAARRCRERGLSVGFFRPITLRPFPGQALKEAAAQSAGVLVAESAYGQLERMVRASLYGERLAVYAYRRAGLGIVPEELELQVMSLISEGRRSAPAATNAQVLAPGNQAPQVLSGMRSSSGAESPRPSH